MELINEEFKNWKTSMLERIRFYQSGMPNRRVDTDYPWEWYYKSRSWSNVFWELMPNTFGKIKSILGKNTSGTRNWFEENVAKIWTARNLLQNEISKSCFDDQILLRILGPGRYYFKPLFFKPLFISEKSENFNNNFLPLEYGSFPLKKFRINSSFLGINSLQIIMPEITLTLLNKYRQYFLLWDDIEIRPQQGDVVFDCGSCIGELSLIFSSIVGEEGAVHTFDPIKLHNKFIEHQLEINCNKRHNVIINNLGVSDITKISEIESNVEVISPGGQVLEEFSTTTLDSYIEYRGLDKVDFIKMDIEGFELKALYGAKRILAELKPKLAICTYHKPEDTWELIEYIKSVNPTYKFYYAHHSPVFWESVLYCS